jgi:beta-lactamase regulating signal transducer with metallopeptidase domain/lambda repressor-like predicted transcriptional regulator
MANWSQSHFLQALGWATLNSFWQMALLWCIYLLASNVFHITSARRYRVSVAAVFIGFTWFLLSFLYYYSSGIVSAVAFFRNNISHKDNLLRVLLTSASLAYISLLTIPVYRFFRNWQFVVRIKKSGISKAAVHYRLFVQKIAAQIGITKNVSLYVSDIVRSPLTVGYIKPVILLPLAALNHLTVQQVEAVLLHELAHIRRYDYLVNLMVSIMQTVLYFNPFVRLFLKNIEQERENCCDELVLNYGYDRIGYATALLTLEKASTQLQVLTMAATGKNYLMTRIEKIIGMEKKKGFRRNHFAGFIAALFCIVAFNSVLIIRDEKKSTARAIAYDNIANPFAFFNSPYSQQPAHSITPVPASMQKEKNNVAHLAPSINNPESSPLLYDAPSLFSDEDPVSLPFMYVALNEAEAALTAEQTRQVEKTVTATRNILNGQWPKVEEAMAEVLTIDEKEIVHQQYRKEVEKVNWKNVEANMKASYNEIDWNGINNGLNTALAQVQLDSIQRNYNLVLTQLNRIHVEISKLEKSHINTSPMPDASIQDIRRAKEEIARQLDSINVIRSKAARKVIKL